jgi:DNA polymerase-3 subunit delta
MQAIEFLRNSSSHAARPVYALTGDDAFLKREAADAVIQAVVGGDMGDDDPYISRYEGDRVDLATVLDELFTVPLFASRRVVFVDNADPFVTANRKELEAYVQKPASRGTLILSVKTWPSNTRLAKLVDTDGWTIDCKTPSERDLPAWLVAQARARWDLKLDSEAARLLLELVGPDLSLLVTELDKLSSYVGGRKGIHREDVARLVGAGRVETIWKMLDAATTGDAPAALDDLDRLIAAGEAPVGLLAAVSASLRKVHHAGVLRLQKREPGEACREAGIPPFAVQNTLKQHTHLGPSRVARLPELLLQADLDLKGNSQLPPRTILERLVITLARPRQD